jgi:hypothetical protein
MNFKVGNSGRQHEDEATVGGCVSGAAYKKIMLALYRQGG